MREINQDWSINNKEQHTKAIKSKVKIYFVIMLINIFFGIFGVIPGLSILFIINGEDISINLSVSLIIVIIFVVLFMLHFLILKRRQDRAFFLVIGFTTFVVSSGVFTWIVYVLMLYTLVGI